MTGEHSLLQRQRIGPLPEHLDIVVGFQDQGLALPQMVPDQLGDPAGIGTIPEADRTVTDDESDRIAGVVGHGKGMDPEVVDDKGFTGSELADLRAACPCVAPRPAGCRRWRRPADSAVWASTPTPRTWSSCSWVTTMAESVSGAMPWAASRPTSLLAGKAVIDEQAGGTGFHQGAVALAAAAKHGEFH